MKRLIFLPLVFISVMCFGQTPGFKLLNSTSSIDPSAEKVSIEGVKKDVYKTPEIISYNYLNQDKTALENELSQIETDLYNNSIGDPDDRYDQTTINSKNKRISEIKAELKEIRIEQDSLYHIYTKDYLQFKNFSLLSFGPKRSLAFFDIIYGNTGDRFKLLNNTGFNLGNKTGSIYSELVSGNLGLFRVSLGAMVSSSSEDSLETAKNNEAFQRLITYGGNTVLNFEYPVAYFHSKNNQYNLISRLIGKGTADFPEFGTTTDSWAGSATIGLDIYADASLSNNALRFFANFNINQIYGTSVFKENLGISESNFSFGQLTLGLVVAQNIKLSFIVSTFSSEKGLNNKNVIAGGQVLH